MAWLASAPTGTSIDAHALLDTLAHLSPITEQTAPESSSAALAPTWRERLWLVPADTRLGVSEASEAIGRPRSWVYRHTSVKLVGLTGADRLPHRKLDGELVFIAGELRRWINANEEMICAAPAERLSLSLPKRAAS